MIKIGIDASRLATVNRTGTEHYTWELLHALGQLDRSNRYTLYCNQRPAVLPPLPPNFVLQPMPFGRAWTLGRLSLEMLRLPPDILFVPAHVLPLINPPRSVVTIHDLGFLYHPEAHTRAQRLHHRLFTRLSAKRATHIITVSEAVKHDLQHFYGIPAAKIEVTYHGVHERFKPVTQSSMLEAAQKRYGIKQPYFLSVGTIQPRKNIARLIEAFAAAHATIDHHINLVLVGKRGWQTEKIERRAAELGIAESVHFAGYVSDQDLPAILSGALAFVFPSLHEGFGMPVLEAQACGTPVLASNVSALPEVVGDSGVLVDPYNVAAIANGLVRLASDPNLRDQLREQGLKHAASWTWERTAHQTLTVLEQIATQ
jgi:glycosyltransferase involved in cell wall biosynthesis